MQSKLITVLAAVALCLGSVDAAARSRSKGSGTTHHSTQHALPHGPATHGPRGASDKVGGADHAPGVKRDADGRIARSAKAKDDFKRGHPCPSTGKTSGACPGYVIDHVQPLKRGGADAPSNMQWQTTAAAKSKDKSE